MTLLKLKPRPRLNLDFVVKLKPNLNRRRKRQFHPLRGSPLDDVGVEQQLILYESGSRLQRMQQTEALGV